MKRSSMLCALAVLAAAVATPSLAGGIDLNGPHYNLNIIGVENPKTDAMTGGARHTTFVVLGFENYAAACKVYLIQGESCRPESPRPSGQALPSLGGPRGSRR